MASAQLGNSESRLDFFQQRILHAIEHWANHEAVQQVEVKVLDLKRETILRAITLGLEFDPAWPLVKRLIIAFTPYMERRGHWDAWYGLLAQAIEVAQAVGDAESETTLTALLARLCQRMSKPDDVIRHYRRVIRLAKRIGNRFEEARACSNLGYLYIDRGQWWRSEVLSQHALTIFEELESDHGRAHTHNHLGLLYDRQERPKLAEHHLKSACEIWGRNQDNHSLINGLTNLGSLHVERQQADSALRYLLQAEKIAEITGETSAIARIWNNMAFAYRLKQHWDKAMHFAIKAEERFREHSDAHQLAKVWHNLGLIMIGKGNKAKAFEYLQDSLKAHRGLNNHSLEKIVLADLARCSNFGP